MRLIRKIVAELRRIRSRDAIADQWHASMRRRTPAPAAVRSPRLRHRAGGRIVTG